MQIEKLLEEQEKEFEEISERQIFLLNGKKGTLKNTIIYDSLLNWHKQSLKQFIDGLVAWQQEEVRHPLETIDHLKEIRETI